MFDLGWTELLVIGIVALIVIGPKDLPVVFRTVGQYVGKAKGMAREFSRAMNDAADDTGVRNMASDINKTLKTATKPVGSAMDGVKSAASKLTDLDPGSETAKLAADREERMEKAKKIQAASARAAAERKMQEAQDALAKAEELEAAATETPKSDT